MKTTPPAGDTSSREAKVWNDSNSAERSPRTTARARPPARGAAYTLVYPVRGERYSTCGAESPGGVQVTGLSASSATRWAVRRSGRCSVTSGYQRRRRSYCHSAVSSSSVRPKTPRISSSNSAYFQMSS